MDFKTAGLLIAASQGLLLSLALFSKFRSTHKSAGFFGIIVFVASVEILNDFAAQSNYHASATAFPFWVLGSYLLWPPALWFFIRLNLHPDFTFKKRQIGLFAPALLQMLIVFSVKAMGLFGVYINLMSFTSWYLFSEILPLLGMVLVMFFYGKYLKDAKKTAEASNTPVILRHVHKHYVIFGVFLCLCLLWISINLSYLKVFAWFSYHQIFNAVEILLVSSIYISGYVAYINPDFFDVPKGLKQTSASKKEFGNYNDQKELNRLNELLHTDKLYTQTKLSLSDLAAALKLPSRYVSHLINTYHSTNFHDFINGFRVNEVIAKINDPRHKHKTLLALAMEAGFNSKSTFNQVFKAHTNKTPSSYFLSAKNRSENLNSDVLRNESR